MLPSLTDGSGSKEVPIHASYANGAEDRGCPRPLATEKPTLEGKELDDLPALLEGQRGRRHCRKGSRGFPVNSQPQINMVLGLVHQILPGERRGELFLQG